LSSYYQKVHVLVWAHISLKFKLHTKSIIKINLHILYFPECNCITRRFW